MVRRHGFVTIDHAPRLGVRGDSETRLEEATVADDASVHWDTACIAPCFTHVSPYALVRANASLPSSPLKLGNHDVILHVDRGKPPLADTSTALITIGAILLAGGGIATPVAAVVAVEDSFAFCFGAGCPTHDRNTDIAVLAGSIATAATGLAMLSAGLLIRPSARASVSFALGGAALHVTF